jgi:hypothetical protein
MVRCWNDGGYETPVVRWPVVEQTTTASGDRSPLARWLRIATMPDTAGQRTGRTAVRDRRPVRVRDTDRAQCHSGLQSRPRGLLASRLLAPKGCRAHLGRGGLRADTGDLAREPALVRQEDQSVDASLGGRSLLRSGRDTASGQHRVDSPSPQAHGRLVETRQALDHESGPAVCIKKLSPKNSLKRWDQWGWLEIRRSREAAGRDLGPENIGDSASRFSSNGRGAQPAAAPTIDYSFHLNSLSEFYCDS